MCTFWLLSLNSIFSHLPPLVNHKSDPFLWRLSLKLWKYLLPHQNFYLFVYFIIQSLFLLVMLHLWLLGKWSCSVMSDSATPWLLCPWDFPGNSTGVDCHFLLQGIFPTHGSNPGLPHCRQMLYCLSHQGSPPVYRCINWGSQTWGRGDPGHIGRKVVETEWAKDWLFPHPKFLSTGL